MANWAKYQEDVIGLPVAKRASHAIHFKRPDGQIEAHITGAPCHYLDTDGLYKPIDTKLVAASGGFYGAPGLGVKIHPDGRVKIDGSDYQQYVELPGAPVGLVDNDRIVREFAGGRHIMYLKEAGYREEIILDSKPPLTGAAASKFISQVTGTILPKFNYYGIKCFDSAKNIFIFTGNLTAFRTWMNNAVYPVTIDPDFASQTADGYIYGRSTSYSTAHNSSSASYSGTGALVGQDWTGTYYYCERGFLFFLTDSIGASATVTSVVLKLVATADNSSTNFDVEIVETVFTNLEASKEQTYDGAMSSSVADWRNTNGMSINTQYTSPALTTGYINKTGTTTYALTSSRDRAHSTPTAQEDINIALFDHATADYRPVLTILYTTGPLVPVVSYYYRKLKE
jgi:hypothetical protein